MRLPAWLSIPVTPLLAALYPFTYFLAVNLNQFRVGEISRTLFILIALAIMITAVFWVATHDPAKSAAAGAVIVLIFLTYGHAFQWIKNSIPFLARTFIWLPASLVLTFIAVLLIVRTRRSLNTLIAVSNIILAVLWILSLVPVLSYFIAMEAEQSTSPSSAQSETAVGIKPDLYLIILDEYTRSDVLQTVDQFDNSGFTNKLDDLGFKTIPCSQSNYAHTNLSMYTMLNLDYPGKLPVDGEKHYIQFSENEISRTLRHSKLRNGLDQVGYKMVAFDTGFAFSEFTDSDYYAKFEFDPDQVNHFESVYQNTTMLLGFRTVGLRFGWISRIGFEYDPSLDIDSVEESPEYNYAIKRFGLDELDNSIEIESPKFVFAHLLAPHRPIVMDRFGNYTGRQELTPKTYTEQIRYVNDRVIATVTRILESSATSPVIVLMSDHGSRESMDTIFTNFISVYAPQSVQDQLYDSITPVNLMRIVAGYLLNKEYPILPDYSFLEDDKKMTSFSIIQKGCEP